MCKNIVAYIHNEINKEIELIHRGTCCRYSGCVWSVNKSEPNWKSFKRLFPYTYKDVFDKKFDEIHPY